MGGGWVGYIYPMMGCAGLFVLLGISTLVLYFWERIQRRRGKEMRVRVSPLAAPEEPPHS